MKNGNKSAFSMPAYTDPKAGRGQNNTHDFESGLTKREYFAGLAMQGLLAGHNKDEKGFYHNEPVAKVAVKYADDLLKILDEDDPR